MPKHRHLILTALLLTTLIISTGCESDWGTAGLGAAGGAAAAGGGYEYRVNREMKRIEEAYEDGEMTQEEYQIRKDQIERMSIIE